jgi:hypothetical protein
MSTGAFLLQKVAGGGGLDTWQVVHRGFPPAKEVEREEMVRHLGRYVCYLSKRYLLKANGKDLRRGGSEVIVQCAFQILVIFGGLPCFESIFFKQASY